VKATPGKDDVNSSSNHWQGREPTPSIQVRARTHREREREREACKCVVKCVVKFVFIFFVKRVVKRVGAMSPTHSVGAMFWCVYVYVAYDTMCI
jgi:hypothetical protein